MSIFARKPKPVCEHDWRQDPKGWIDGQAPTRELHIRRMGPGFTFRYINLHCAKCPGTYQEIDAKRIGEDWAKAPESWGPKRTEVAS